MTWIADGELGQSFANKLNNVNSVLRVAVTDETVTAGTITEIPITDIGSGVLSSGDILTIENIADGTTFNVTLSDNYYTGGDNHLHISSYVLTNDLLTESSIYFPLSAVLSIIRSI